MTLIQKYKSCQMSLTQQNYGATTERIVHRETTAFPRHSAVRTPVTALHYSRYQQPLGSTCENLSTDLGVPLNYLKLQICMDGDMHSIYRIVYTGLDAF